MSTGSQNGHPAHLSAEVMRKYQAHSLAVNELRTADRHLRDCGRCRRVLLARMGPLRMPEEVETLTGPLHLSYEQITAYIDGALENEEMAFVEAHTFLCPSCSREIADLRRLEARLVTAAVEVREGAPKRSFTDRIVRFFGTPGHVRGVGLAFGAVVAGIFLLLQAGRGGSEGSGTAARIVHPGAEMYTGMHLGGYVLVAAGITYLAYIVWRKR